jgi:hypothetical protein
MAYCIRLSKCIVSAIAATASASIVAQPTQADPAVTDWIYGQHADIVTGVMTPGASLMSTNALPLSELRKHEKRNAYLGVRRTPEQSMEATFSVDGNSSAPKAGACDPVACSLKVRFGTSAPQTFIAVQHPNANFHYVIKDARTFWDVAAKSTGPIEVQYQDLSNRTFEFQFMTKKPLQPNKLQKR